MQPHDVWVWRHRVQCRHLRTRHSERLDGLREGLELVELDRHLEPIFDPPRLEDRRALSGAERLLELKDILDVVHLHHVRLRHLQKPGDDARGEGGGPAGVTLRDQLHLQPLQLRTLSRDLLRLPVPGRRRRQQRWCGSPTGPLVNEGPSRLRWRGGGGRRRWRGGGRSLCVRARLARARHQSQRLGNRLYRGL
eukprot:3784074-Prymnesium_polylepis.2